MRPGQNLPCPKASSCLSLLVLPPSQLCSDATDGEPHLLQDLVTVTKLLVTAEVSLVPLSGSRQQEGAILLKTVSCNRCGADPTLGPAGCQPGDKKGIQGREKLGKIKTGKGHFFHMNTELDSRAHGRGLPLKPRI